jgi:Flp pilus assembly protein TadG
MEDGMLRWRRNFRRAGGRRWSGTSLVELALTAPLLALILVGAVDLGRVFIYYERLTSAVREGAIYASYQTDKTSIRDRAYAETNGQLGTTGVDFVVDTTSDIKFYQGATTTEIASNKTPGSGDSVEVTGHYRFRPMTSTLVRILPANYQIRKSVRMVLN